MKRMDKSIPQIWVNFSSVVGTSQQSVLIMVSRYRMLKAWNVSTAAFLNFGNSRILLQKFSLSILLAFENIEDRNKH